MTRGDATLDTLRSGGRDGLMTGLARASNSNHLHLTEDAWEEIAGSPERLLLNLLMLALIPGDELRFFELRRAVLENRLLRDEFGAAKS